MLQPNLELPELFLFGHFRRPDPPTANRHREQHERLEIFLERQFSLIFDVDRGEHAHRQEFY